MEAIQSILECAACGKQIGGYGADEIQVAEDAAEEGWRMNRDEDVLCPNCKRVPKRKL